MRIECIRCGDELRCEFGFSSHYHPPVCEKCFYTCPICNEYDPDSCRFSIIEKTNIDGIEKEEIVCVKCGKEWERNRYKAEMSILLSNESLVCLDQRKEKEE